MITKEKLKFFIDNNFNVLFKGPKGVGKTSIIKEVFEEAGLNYICLGGATIDPYIDFVGVPIHTVDESGKSVIDMVLPKYINAEELEAIVIDEYNRSPKKVRNACMELILNKSINGRPFPKLRIVWAAINPEDEDEKAFK